MVYLVAIAECILKFITTNVENIKMRNRQDAESIASHFATYFEPDVSNSEESINASFGIRHNVYAEELKLEPIRANKLETDDFDSHSIHCLIKHRLSSTFAGTVRIITSQSEKEKLPIEVFCNESIEDEEFLPSNFERKDIVEISRLAVPEHFRRRQMDEFDGAAIGAINEHTYSETELRCFPFIAVGLYLSATAVLIENNIHHCYVMVEPRLARSMRLVGLPFKQIGSVVDYHGQRAPFIINPMEVPANLRRGFGELLTEIQNDISSSRSALIKSPLPQNKLHP